jgi:hypothetical protein
MARFLRRLGHDDDASSLRGAEAAGISREANEFGSELLREEDAPVASA